jgi:hypothetical protein
MADHSRSIDDAEDDDDDGNDDGENNKPKTICTIVKRQMSIADFFN